MFSVFVISLSEEDKSVSGWLVVEVAGRRIQVGGGGEEEEEGRTV